MNLYKVKFLYWQHVVAETIAEAVEKAEKEAKENKALFNKVKKVKLIEENITI